MAGKGRVAKGYDADLTIVDLKRRETIRNEWVASRVGWTPFHGLEGLKHMASAIVPPRPIQCCSTRQPAPRKYPRSTKATDQRMPPLCA